MIDLRFTDLPLYSKVISDVNFEAGACVFVTLTFRENVQDYDTAVKGFKLFTKRLRRKLEDVHYIATLEIQQRGAYYFHLLINAPDTQFGLDNVTPLWKMESWTL